jgi:hypothetical protein
METQNKLYTQRELMTMLDNKSLEERRELTNKTKLTYGFVDYRHIFMSMGFVHAFNGNWKQAN